MTLFCKRILQVLKLSMIVTPFAIVLIFMKVIPIHDYPTQQYLQWLGGFIALSAICCYGGYKMFDYMYMQLTTGGKK